MVEQRVNSVTDFNWVSQLRYEWSPAWKPGQAVKTGDDTLVIRIVNAKVSCQPKINIGTRPALNFVPSPVS